MVQASLDEIRSELEEAARYRNDEIGEWWLFLVEAYRHMIVHASSELLQAYEKELRSEHDIFKTEYRLIEKTITKTVKYRVLLHETEAGEDQ